MTRMGVLFTWISAPTGLTDTPNSCFATVAPMTTTSEAASSSSSSMARPSSMRQLVMGG